MMAASTSASSKLTPCSEATCTRRRSKLGHGESRVLPASRNTHSSGRGITVGLLMGGRLSARPTALFREPALNLPPDVVELAARVVEPALVAHHKLSAGPLRPGRELGRDA